MIDERVAIPGWELLHGVDALLAEVVAGRNLRRHWMRLCVAKEPRRRGLWRRPGALAGPRLAFYDALKLPLVLLLTSALTVGFAWTAAVVLGLPLRFGPGGAIFVSGKKSFLEQIGDVLDEKTAEKPRAGAGKR